LRPKRSVLGAQALNCAACYIDVKFFKVGHYASQFKR